MRRGFTLVGLVLVSLLMAGADGDYVRLSLESGGTSPYGVVRYEVFDRGGAVAAVHRRQLPGHGESLQGMGLLLAREATEVFDLLDRYDAVQLPDADAPPGLPFSSGQSWRVEVQRAGKRHAFRVVEPWHQEDLRYQGLLAMLVETVEAHAGPQPFRNIFFPEAELGWLDVESVPPARLFVDGEDTRLETPVYGYEVEAGAHQLTLKPVNPDAGPPGTYDVFVDPTGTTRLRVVLR